MRLTVDEIKVLKRSFEDSKAKVEKARQGSGEPCQREPISPVPGPL